MKDVLYEVNFTSENGNVDGTIVKMADNEKDENIIYEAIKKLSNFGISLSPGSVKSKISKVGNNNEKCYTSKTNVCSSSN